ncbi:MAG: hypothetical protein HZB15_16795, partial [Actinobacteria bacterium]|nr:hypothetical protein [Actinomycetota bacterium]
MNASLLVGRDGDLRSIAEAYRGRTVDLVVLLGAAGVGKSHLAAAALDAVAREGAPVRRAVCTASLQQVPFASIAGIAALAAGADDAGTLQLAAAARAALVTAPRTALSIDDVNFLDEPSAGLLAQLVGNDRLFVVATVRRSLWIDLQALDRDRARLLVELILDGPVEAAAEHAIWSVSQGNPLYIRELVAASVSAGSLRRVRDAFSLVAPLARGQRLQDLVSSRLGTLDADETELAQLLALCQPVPLSAVPDHLLPAAEQLERSGHLALDDDGTRLRLSHPLYAEVIGEGISRLTRQRLLREHLRRLGDTMPGAIDDDMSRVVLELDAGVSPAPERLMRATRLARQAPDFRLVKRLAVASLAADGTNTEARLLLCDALYELGEHEASRDEHAIGFEQAPDEFTVMLFATSAHRIHLWGLDAPDDAIAMLREALERVTTPMLRDAIASAEMNVLAFSDRPLEALALDERITDESVLVEEIAAVSRSVALTCTGRAAEAIVVSRE